VLSSPTSISLRNGSTTQRNASLNISGSPDRATDLARLLSPREPAGNPPPPLSSSSSSSAAAAAVAAAAPHAWRYPRRSPVAGGEAGAEASGGLHPIWLVVLVLCVAGAGAFCAVAATHYLRRTICPRGLCTARAPFRLLFRGAAGEDSRRRRKGGCKLFPADLGASVAPEVVASALHKVASGNDRASSTLDVTGGGGEGVMAAPTPATSEEVFCRTSAAAPLDLIDEGGGLQMAPDAAAAAAVVVERVGTEFACCATGVPLSYGEWWHRAGSSYDLSAGEFARRCQELRTQSKALKQGFMAQYVLVRHAGDIAADQWRYHSGDSRGTECVRWVQVPRSSSSSSSPSSSSRVMASHDKDRAVDRVIEARVLRRYKQSLWERALPHGAAGAAEQGQREYISVEDTDEEELG
jgi:hypothetical protein